MEIFQYSQLNTLGTPSTSDTQSSEHFKEFTQDDKKSFRCTYPNCGKVFKFKSEITRHNVIHFDSRPFPCPHEGCGKSFKRADALETHVRLHTKDMPFECDFSGCDKKFTTKAALKYHILKHNDERSFKCPFPGCDKSFYTKGQLRQHEKALNYHLSLSVVKVEEEEESEVKTVLSYSKIKTEDYYKEFYAPTPRLATNVEWEVKNQVSEENPIKQEEDQQESFENIIKYIFRESSSTKEKVDLYTKTTDNSQGDEEASSYIGHHIDWSEPLKEPSVFFDENDFKILDFLKEQAHNGY